MLHTHGMIHGSQKMSRSGWFNFLSSVIILSPDLVLFIKLTYLLQVYRSTCGISGVLHSNICFFRNFIYVVQSFRPRLWPERVLHCYDHDSCICICCYCFAPKGKCAPCWCFLLPWQFCSGGQSMSFFWILHIHYALWSRFSLANYMHIYLYAIYTSTSPLCYLLYNAFRKKNILVAKFFRLYRC